MASAQIEMKNLIVLSYANNECYTDLHKVGEDGKPVPNYNDDSIRRRTQDLEIDLDKSLWKRNIWTWGRGWVPMPIPIGKSALDTYTGDRKPNDGVIGVYDMTNFEHLRSMVDDAKEATETHDWSGDP